MKTRLVIRRASATHDLGLYDIVDESFQDLQSGGVQPGSHGYFEGTSLPLRSNFVCAETVASFYDLPRLPGNQTSGSVCRRRDRGFQEVQRLHAHQLRRRSADVHRRDVTGRCRQLHRITGGNLIRWAPPTLTGGTFNFKKFKRVISGSGVVGDTVVHASGYHLSRTALAPL